MPKTTRKRTLSKATKNAVNVAVTKKLLTFEEEKAIAWNSTTFDIGNAFNVAGGYQCFSLLERHPKDTTSTTAINQGTGSNERVGNRIRVKEIQIQMELKPGADDPLGNSCRVILVKDKQWKNGSAPAPGNYVVDGADYNSLLNHDRRKLYYVYDDRSHGFITTGTDVAGTAYTGGPVWRYSLTIKPNLVIEYDGNDGTSTHINNQNLIMLIAGDSGNGTTTKCCTAAIRWRVIYTEAAS